MSDDRTVRRDNAVRSGVLGVLVLALVANLLTTARPLVMGARPVFVVDRQIADAGKLGPVLDDYGVHVLKGDHVPLGLLLWRLAVPERTPEPEPAAQPIHLGWSGFEHAVLGLPLWVGADMGAAIGYDGQREYVAAPLEAVDFARLRLPRPEPGGMWLARLTHMWGWLVLLALAAYGVFELRAAAHRREAAGII